MKKRLLLLLLALFILGGCKKEEKVSYSVNKNAVYKSQTIKIELPIGYEDYIVGESHVSEEKIAFLCFKSEESNSTLNTIWKLGFSDGQANNVCIWDCFKDIDNNARKYVVQNIVGYSKNLVAVDYYIVEDKEDAEMIEDSEEFGKEYIGIFNECGEKIAELEVDNCCRDSYFINDRVVINEYDWLLSWDYNSNEVVKKNFDCFDCYYLGASGSLIALRNGKDGNREYVYINAKTLEEEKCVNESLKIDNNRCYICSGYEKEELLIFGEKSVLGYTPGEEETHLICDIEYSGLYFGGNIVKVFTEETGNFYILAATPTNQYEDEFKLIKATKIPPEEVKDRVEIKIGCLGISYSDVKSFVAELNSSSDEFYYSLKEYHEDENEDDYLAPMDEFAKDIIGKNVPDIIMCENGGSGQNFNLNKYISNGIFMPLNSLIESDPEVDMQDLFPCLKEFCSYNGKMYTVIPNFTIKTMICKSDAYNSDKGMTYSDFENVLTNHPRSRTFFNATREEICQNFLSMEDNSFFSSISGSCNFTSQEFKNFLDFLQNCTEEYSFDRDSYEYDDLMSKSYINDESLFMMCELENAESLVIYEKLFFRDETSAAGYPNERGYRGYIVPRTYTIGISSKTKSPEAAWNFLRKFLTDDYQGKVEYSIPASQKAFEYQSAQLLNKDSIKAWYMYDYIDIGKLRQKDIDKFKEIIVSSGGYSYYEKDITQLVLEESQPYFGGEKTLAEVVKIIQSRASVFLKEKK